MTSLDVHAAGHRWHVVERRPLGWRDGDVTVVCVHGNPTWSALWTPVLDAWGDRWRVLAPDLLGMGRSDRTSPRSYADRVADLAALLDELAPTGPVVLVAHDWGGAIAMGWAVDHPDRVQAMVLANTGIAVPAGRSAPAIIRLAAARPVRDFVCRRTPVFVAGTSRVVGSRVTVQQRRDLAAPYRRAADRAAIADFVADIPLRPDHPSAAALARVAERLGDLDVPVLLVWGSRDPVFDDDFADDLLGRFRHAELHRFPRAGHLTPLEPGFAEVAGTWLESTRRSVPAAVAPNARWIGAGLDERSADTSVAFVDGTTGRSATFAELHAQVERTAAGLLAAGVQPGDRVAVLVLPGVDLLATVYACWRIGAVTVVADRGLGLRGLGDAVRGARVRWVVGTRQTLAAARTLRWAPRATCLRVDGLTGTAPLPQLPRPEAPAAVVFTSGATGPAKGVRYRHGQLAAQRDALTALFDVTTDDRFVAAFAPFSVFGPALGIASAIPDCDVTTPGKLTAATLDEACASIDATMVFASPAALANVVATAGASHPAIGRLRLVMSAGAPVPVRTLEAVARLAPAAALHTPYGMTECLPVASLDLVGIRAAGTGDGVCVGEPVPGCDVEIVDGEILVSAPWCSDGYDRLWATQQHARPDRGDGRVWHRTGDVGHLDADGRLWVEGRVVHVVHTVAGPVTPVPVEQAAERATAVSRSAAVGVGPPGVQQLVVVLEVPGRAGLTDDATARAVRSAVPHPVAAVLQRPALPVDIRHNAKIDRTELAQWAARVLAGGRP